MGSPDQPLADDNGTAALPLENPGQTDEVLDSIPTPILRLLVILARPIAAVRKSLEILSWKSASPVDSWLLLGAWWALCLGGRAAWK